MKVPLVATVLIVVTAGVLAWLQNERIKTVRKDHVVLVERAAALGLTAAGTAAGKSGSAQGSTGTRAGARAGGSAKDQARAFAQELFAFAAKVKQWEEAGDERPAEAEREITAFLQRFLELDPKLLPHLLDEVRGTDELDEHMRRGIVMFSFMSLSQSSPERALNLYAEAEDLLDENGSEQVVEMAITAWSRDDPLKSLEWLELNGETLPKEHFGEWRNRAIASAFRVDPDAALREVRKLEPRDAASIGEETAKFIRDPAKQLTLLRSIVDLETVSEEDRSTESGLGRGIAKGLGENLTRLPFDSAEAFMQEGELSAAERSHVAHSIVARVQHLQDIGKWIPWVNENADPNRRGSYVRELVRSWTRNDFRATAAWIGAQPGGALREQATHQFAESVASHEPASAAEWALTLPESEQRTKLLHEVHGYWKRKDREAAAAFAAEHGLTPQ